MYKFGYFFHLANTRNLYQELVLGFDGNYFNFYFIDKKIVPRKYTNSRGNYFNLNIPVLYCATRNIVTKIIFFNDLNIENLTRNDTSFNQIKLIVGESVESHDIIDGSKSIFDNKFLTAKDIEFGKLLIEKFVSEKYITKLKTDSSYISGTDKVNESKWKGVIKTYKDYIESIDLEKILKSLWVKVWDFQKNKIGDNDSYYVYREAKLLDGTVITDPYLKNIIGLGKICIHEDSSYKSIFTKPSVPFGVYENEILLSEKHRIIDQYSKEEHMGWLFYNQLFLQERLKTDIICWEERIKSAKTCLENQYFYSDLNGLNHQLFYSFDSLIHNHNDILKRINRLIYKIQKQTPKLHVVISGMIPFNESNKYIRKIEEIINNLSNNYRLILVTGNAKGAEKEAMSYASDNQIEFICEYNDWTLCGRDKGLERANKMIEISQLLILTESESYLSKNLILEANAKGIPINILNS